MAGVGASAVERHSGDDGLDVAGFGRRQAAETSGWSAQNLSLISYSAVEGYGEE